MPGGNATVVAKANEFERTGLFWEITRWKGGKEAGSKAMWKSGPDPRGLPPQALQSRLHLTHHQGTFRNRETCSDGHIGRKTANKFP